MFESIQEWTTSVREQPLPDGDAARIDEIRALEELVCSAQARQAVLTAEFWTVMVCATWRNRISSSRSSPWVRDSSRWTFGSLA